MARGRVAHRYRASSRYCRPLSTRCLIRACPAHDISLVADNVGSYSVTRVEAMVAADSRRQARGSATSGGRERPLRSPVPATAEMPQADQVFSAEGSANSNRAGIQHSRERAASCIALPAPSARLKYPAESGRCGRGRRPQQSGGVHAWRKRVVQRGNKVTPHAEPVPPGIVGEIYRVKVGRQQ